MSYSDRTTRTTFFFAGVALAECTIPGASSVIAAANNTILRMKPFLPEVRASDVG
jgi:hypothetical protein